MSHNFYEREIVKGNTITYKVDYSLGSLYQISNINNTRVGELMTLKDGSIPTKPLGIGDELDIASWAVSYTHLDVYKRQPFLTEELWQNIAPREDGESLMVSRLPEVKCACGEASGSRDAGAEGLLAGAELLLSLIHIWRSC